MLSLQFYPIQCYIDYAIKILDLPQKYTNSLTIVITNTQKLIHKISLLMKITINNDSN